MSFLHEDATDMPFRDGFFDAVVGFSLLEHVQDVPALSREIARVLAPDGLVFLTGGPVWTSSVGHHVWVSVDGTHYRFNDASNPVPDWGHLTLSRDELLAELTARTGRPRHARAIVDMIHDSPLLNRRSPGELMDAFRGEFDLRAQFYRPKPLPPAVAGRLGGGTDWEIQALFLFLERHAGAPR